ncbi:hypothetical protein MAPG_02104 [Magnaporthiopsis poae ATCC 64411]|uniref:Serine hydrolase domain-containing protein n=1 Tax=Magnaporthiopsis poae (strain ATCC 64411 / 73-15) TaxID=644358 RepID=A0A0C4DQG4_MAGP6|nr:hypothetical protein MAPG_02104 [Magnaporthiopsis poae ATCC 64411]
MRIAFPCLKAGFLRVSSRRILGLAAVLATRRVCTTMASAGSQEPQPGADVGAARKKQPAAAKPAKKEVKILMLHGYTQSGTLFHAKTRALEKLLVKTLAPWNLVPVLHYATGPAQVRPADMPGFTGDAESDPRAQDAWAWFRRDEAANTYRRLPEGMRTVVAAIRSLGGIDAVLGFSQGGTFASMVTAALEPDRSVPETPSPASGDDWSWVQELRAANGHRPLRFAVIYSAFLAAPPDLAWLSEPAIETPTLHFIGSLDTVVDERRSRDLVARCRDAIVVEHPGAHYVPISKEWAMPLLGFVKKRCVDDEQDAVAANL